MCCWQFFIQILYFFPAAAQDRPSAKASKSEKQQPPKEQVFLVPSGEDFGPQVRP